MFSIRLKEVRESKDLSQQAFANKFGVSQSTIGMWESGKREPNFETIQRISLFFNVSIDYLLGRTDFSAEENRQICQNISRLCKTIKNPPNPEGIVGIVQHLQQIHKNEYQFTYETLKQFASYFDVGTEVLVAEPLPVQKSKGVKIPVLGQVAAGIPMEAIENIVDYEEISEEMASSGEYFGLKIKGSSMEPRIKEGDVVIVRQQPEIESGDIAIVMVNGDNATCKKIILNSDGITLIPYNSTYEPIFYTAEQVEQLPVRIIGKVVELRGKF